MAKSALKKIKMTATTTKAVLKDKIVQKRLTIRSKNDKSVSNSEIAALKSRDELIEKYMPFATSIANRVAQSLSSAVDYDEVLCNARIGLLEAAKKYDEAQQVDFRTFAYYRIKGAIYDGLRKSGWVPRALYTKIKMEEAANDYLRFKAEHSEEIEASDTVAESQLIDTVNSLASIYVISLDASPEIDIEDENAVDLERGAEFKQIREHMRQAIDSLPPKEKKLIKMYYFQNKTLEEAGDKLELSKSWTSRLHARALDLLFRRIRAISRGDDDFDCNEELKIEGE